MNIVIIEDEFGAYNRLSRLVTESFPGSVIVAHLNSVQSARQWFGEAAMPDLVFIDINLGDGTAFDVLNLVPISCPFVFTTAYDEYAIEAYKTNGIAYLLKPVTKEDLDAVPKKMEDYIQMFGSKEQQLKYKQRFIIRLGEQIKMLRVEEIAYFYSQGGQTFLRTFDERLLPIDYSLDVLQKILDPKMFFRLSRQYLACLNAIAKIKVHDKSRVGVTLNPPAQDATIISSERSTEFKQWLAGEL